MRGKRWSVFWCDEGFSTAGMAVALLLTLSLVFTCARVYEINTESAQVQEVADAAALAAENVVGEFYVVVSVCDALTFSLSLAMVASLGLGVVCACVPPAAAASKVFFEAAEKIAKARDSFYDSATDSLDQLQKALPFIATVKAQEIFAANSGGSDGASYQGIVLLAPWEGDSGEALEFNQADAAQDAASETKDDLAAAAEEAEQIAEEANSWKEIAYQADSGSKTAYCMYERAATLAGLQGSQNPYFSSVDTWSFSVALQRAQTYYRARYLAEAPQGSSVDERANSALRKRFYSYAMREVGAGYVLESEDSFAASFPLLPKNTDEMRATSLYTEAVYPITQDGQGMLTMHAWDGCPGMELGSRVGTGAIRDMDGNSAYVVCPRCEFRASSMGKVAAASTAIENGFEYHYNIVAEAAEEYEKARSAYSPLAKKVKDLAGQLFEKLGDALSEAASKRISMLPPGHRGAVALVVDTSSPATAFPSSFVSDEGELGVRAAISSATLVRESSDEGQNVIASFLDGYASAGSFAAGAADKVMEVWAGVLGVYTQGHDAFFALIQDVLDKLPLASASGLGTWASDKLEEVVADFGFDPPDLRARKAALVNSERVLEADDSAYSAKLLSVKRQAVAAGGGGFDGVLSAVESSALDAVEELSSEFEVATIVLLDGLVEIPLTITLPSAVTEGLAGAVQGGIDQLRNAVAVVTGVRQWR